MQTHAVLISKSFSVDKDPQHALKAREGLAELLIRRFVDLKTLLGRGRAGRPQEHSRLKCVDNHVLKGTHLFGINENTEAIYRLFFPLHHEYRSLCYEQCLVCRKQHAKALPRVMLTGRFLDLGIFFSSQTVKRRVFCIVPCRN